MEECQVRTSMHVSEAWKSNGVYAGPTGERRKLRSWHEAIDDLRIREEKRRVVPATTSSRVHLFPVCLSLDLDSVAPTEANSSSMRWAVSVLAFDMARPRMDVPLPSPGRSGCHEALLAVPARNVSRILARRLPSYHCFKEGILPVWVSR